MSPCVPSSLGLTSMCVDQQNVIVKQNTKFFMTIGRYCFIVGLQLRRHTMSYCQTHEYYSCL